MNKIIKLILSIISVTCAYHFYSSKTSTYATSTENIIVNSNQSTQSNIDVSELKTNFYKKCKTILSAEQIFSKINDPILKKNVTINNVKENLEKIVNSTIENAIELAKPAIPKQKHNILTLEFINDVFFTILATNFFTLYKQYILEKAALLGKEIKLPYLTNLFDEIALKEKIINILKTDFQKVAKINFQEYANVIVATFSSELFDMFITPYIKKHSSKKTDSDAGKTEKTDSDANMTFEKIFHRATNQIIGPLKNLILDDCFNHPLFDDNLRKQIYDTLPEQQKAKFEHNFENKKYKLDPLKKYILDNFKNDFKITLNDILTENFTESSSLNFSSKPKLFESIHKTLDKKIKNLFSKSVVDATYTNMLIDIDKNKSTQVDVTRVRNNIQDNLNNAQNINTGPVFDTQTIDDSIAQIEHNFQKRNIELSTSQLAELKKVINQTFEQVNYYFQIPIKIYKMLTTNEHLLNLFKSEFKIQKYQKKYILDSIISYFSMFSNPKNFGILKYDCYDKTSNIVISIAKTAMLESLNSNKITPTKIKQKLFDTFIIALKDRLSTNMLNIDSIYIEETTDTNLNSIKKPYTIPTFDTKTIDDAIEQIKYNFQIRNIQLSPVKLKKLTENINQTFEQINFYFEIPVNICKILTKNEQFLNLFKSKFKISELEKAKIINEVIHCFSKDFSVKNMYLQKLECYDEASKIITSITENAINNITQSLKKNDTATNKIQKQLCKYLMSALQNRFSKDLLNFDINYVKKTTYNNVSTSKIFDNCDAQIFEIYNEYITQVKRKHLVDKISPFREQLIKFLIDVNEVIAVIKTKGLKANHKKRGTFMSFTDKRFQKFIENELKCKYYENENDGKDAIDETYNAEKLRKLMINTLDEENDKNAIILYKPEKTSKNYAWFIPINSFLKLMDEITNKSQFKNLFNQNIDFYDLIYNIFIFIKQNYFNNKIENNFIESSFQLNLNDRFFKKDLENKLTDIIKEFIRSFVKSNDLSDDLTESKTILSYLTIDKTDLDNLPKLVGETDSINISKDNTELELIKKTVDNLTKFKNFHKKHTRDALNLIGGFLDNNKRLQKIAHIPKQHDDLTNEIAFIILNSVKDNLQPKQIMRKVQSFVSDYYDCLIKCSEIEPIKFTPEFEHTP